MKIIETYIKDNSLFITLDETVDITKIYLDTMYNTNNIYSLDNTKHSYVITENLGAKNIFEINIAPFVDKALVVTVISSDESDQALAIDNEYLYKMKVAMLINYCNKCVNNEDKEKIILVELRSNLLLYAIDNNLLEEAIMHYKSLDRLLDNEIINTSGRL